MNEKLLSMIAAGLALVAVIVSVVVLLTVMGMSKKINILVADVVMTEEAQAEEIAVPISQQKTYEMPSSVIASFPSPDGEKVMNVSVSLAIGVDMESKEYSDLDVLLTEGSAMTVIKDRIAGLLATKDYAYMEQKDLQKQLRDEILLLVRAELETEAVVDIYFPDGILKSVK